MDADALAFVQVTK
jgi:hypothetical protein